MQLLLLIPFTFHIIRANNQELDVYNHPEKVAHNLISNIQAGIHDKNLKALWKVLSPHSYSFIREQFEKIRLPKIPVLNIIEVDNVNVRLPMMKFDAKVGEQKHTFVAEFSSAMLKLMLHFDDFWMWMVDHKVLTEEIKKDQESTQMNAHLLLLSVRESIRHKDKESFLKSLAPNAQFLTCNGGSQNAENVFNELTLIQSPTIPVFSKFEVKSVKDMVQTITFNSAINGQYVEYKAVYSESKQRWLLEQESCSKYYSALVNQTGLAEEIALNMVGRFIYALKFLSPKRLSEVTSPDGFNVTRCDQGSTEHYEGVEFFYHYLNFPQFYEIGKEYPGFDLSDIVFDMVSGSLKFVVDFNNITQNEVMVERFNGDYRIVSLRNLKCQNLSSPNLKAQESYPNLYAMMAAEELISKYVHACQTNNTAEFAQLITYPYTLTNGVQIKQDDVKYLWFSENYPDLYVISVQYDLRGLVSFRAKPMMQEEGYEFGVWRTEELNYPNIDAHQLLSDAQAAIRIKNMSALSELLTSEVAELVSKEFAKIRVPKIPVHCAFIVENVNVEHLPMVTFTGKVHEFNVNCEAIYSEDKKRYLLSKKDCLDLLIKKDALEKSIRFHTNQEASILLNKIKYAIQNKNRELFMKSVTPTSKFITCDKKSKNAKKVFDEIQKIPTIPLNRDFEIISADVSGNRMIFHAKIGDKDIQYMARYSDNQSEWLLGQESCSEHYPALINQTTLPEKIAIDMVTNFITALRLESPKILSKVLSVYDFNVMDCNGNETMNFKKTNFVHHYLEFPQYYQIGDYSSRFKLSDIVFNITTGSLKFVVELNNLAKNEIIVKRFNEEYRIVSIRHLKCQNFSSGYPETYLDAMLAAEELTTRYVFMHHTKNTKEFSRITTDPYTLASGEKMKHNQLNYFWFNESFPYLDVLDVVNIGSELKSFRAKPIEDSEGYEYEFMVSKNKNSSLINYKLTSEKKIFVE